MDQEQLLLKIKGYCGGPGNVNFERFNENRLNMTVKDRSLVELSKINQLDTIETAELTNSRLKVVLKKGKSEEEDMAKKKIDYDEVARVIVANVGGKENVRSLRHCITRVRFQLIDEGKANDEVLNNTEGVISVVKAGGEYMVVIGNHVGEVYTAINKLIGIDGGPVTVTEEKSGKRKNPVVQVLNTIVGAIGPVLNMICAGGVLKGLLTILTMTGLVSADSGAYMLINGMGDAVFYFLPLALGYNLAKKLGGEPFLGLVIGGILCHPTLNGVDVELFGHVINATYTSSFLPVIIITAIAVPFSKLLNKFIPKVVSGFLTPVITLLVVIPLGFVFIGPAANGLGTLVNSGITALLNTFPVLAGMLVCGVYQILVLFGLHNAVTSFSFINVLSGNPDQLMALILFPSFAQIGVVLAMYLKTKDAKLKSIALPAFISGIFGVTEPAIYGVTLPRLKMFIISCIGATTSGIVVMLSGTTMYSFTGMGIVSLLGMVAPDNPNFLFPILAAIVPFVVSFIIAFVVYRDKKETV